MTSGGANSYVCQLSLKQARQLQELLAERGWELGQLPHAHWQARREKTNVVAYQSGKLVVQGKGTRDFVLFILEPEILKKASLGYESLDDGPAEPFVPHAGLDESGKGDFFGPLVVAAVFVDEAARGELEKRGVKDSKAIKSEKQMAFLANAIRQTVKGRFSVVPIGPEAYNRLYEKIGNLNRLLAWGHARALENLLEKEGSCGLAVADKFGNENLIKNALLKKAQKIELKQRVRAESDIAVAAASILARDDFVRRLQRLGEEHAVVLPKGAGLKVEETAVEIIRQHGVGILSKVAKVHFKTSEKVILAAVGEAPEGDSEGTDELG